MFFEAITQQSLDRAKGQILDLESYISLRRDTSGCKPVFVLMEYAAGIDLPDHVAEHPIIRDLNEATNDLVTWSNVNKVVSVAFAGCLSYLISYRTSSRTASNKPAAIRIT
jgi:hypothetical protein